MTRCCLCQPAHPGSSLGRTDWMRTDAAIRMRSILVFLLVSLAGALATPTPTPQVPIPPEIRYLHIESSIAYRFSTTRVESMLANKDNKPREAIFNIQLPKSAFITTFSMTIEGVTYDGTVKEKEAARREYIEAKRRGQSAGHIAAKPRNTNSFDVSVNVAPQQKVTFNLTYQELLQRTLSMYQNVIYINPGQIVNDLKVDVFIDESREINSLRVPALQKDVLDTLNTFEANPNANILKISPTSAHVSYYPSAALQKEMSAKGISGQFVVQYDVQRGNDAGDIQVVDGYFVHFIAPSGLPAVKKNVLFILDISGSMYGTKLRQVKEAMKVILDDLQPGDLFNIFLFDDRIRKWNSTGMVPVNDVTLRQAKEYVKAMRTNGATDINLALTSGIAFLDEEKRQEKPLNPSSLILFLTDGDPTSGEVRTDRILENVRDANEDGGYSIFSLGFGDGVDFSLLRKISLQNNAIARKIYEDSDAALQLQGFYKEIGTPLLSGVEVEYVDAENTTRSEFPNYFNGSEIVICGVFDPDFDVDDDDDDMYFRTKVRGNSNGEDVVIEKGVKVLDSSTGLRASTERLWAYLTIKELLDKMEQETDDDAKAEFKARALSLSLKYSFVTPLTSMIVRKPNQNDSLSGLSDSDSRGRPEGRAGSQGQSFSPMSSYSGPAPQGLSGNSGRGRSLGGSVYDYDPQPMGLSGSKGRAPPPDAYDYDDDNDYDLLTTARPTTPSTPPPRPVSTGFQNIGAFALLHGIDGPRVLYNNSGVKFCHDPPVVEGETKVLESMCPSRPRVYATFTTIDGHHEEVMTGVRVVLPRRNLTMTADLNDIDVLCHGSPETRTWSSLAGTNQDLVMPGMMPGHQQGSRGAGGRQSSRGVGGHHGQRGKGDRGGHHGRPRGVWATMESHQLRIHVSKSLCVLVTRTHDSVLGTDYLSIKVEVTAVPVRRLTGMIGYYLNGALDTAGDFRMKDDSGSPRVLLPISQQGAEQHLENPFSQVEEVCPFIL